MSDVEMFYTQIQAKLGGNIPWKDLYPAVQLQLINAINILLSTASAVVTPQGESNG